MTIRHAMAAAIVVGSLATGISVPAHAQQAKTFEAWGHTFNVPGSSFGVPSVPTRESAVQAFSPTSPNSSYASTSARTVSPSTNSQQAGWTIKVRDTRWNAPSY